MELIQTIRTAAGRLARQSLASDSARGVRVAAIDVQTTDAERPELEVAYHLAADGAADGKPLLFDCLPTPGSLSDIECGAAAVRLVHTREDASRAAIVELAPPPGGEWDDLTMRFRVRWDPDAPRSPDCFAVPDFLPAILASDDRAHDQSEVRLTRLGSALSAGFLRGPEGRARTVQAVLFPSSLAHPHGSPDSVIALNGRRFQGLRLGEVRRVERLTENILEFLAEYFGSRPDARIFMTSPESFAGAIQEPTGAVLAARAAWFGLRGREPADVQLAMRLSGLWWGGGIRVAGRDSREVLSAIRATAGLAWSRCIGEQAAYDRAVEQLTREVRSAVPVLFQRAWGTASRKLIARLVMRLVELGAAEPGSTILREWTNDRWGRVLPASGVFDLQEKREPG